MIAPRWPVATQDRPCPICGHTNRCKPAPDGTASLCWRNGGKVIQLNGHANGNGHAKYVGQTHRPKPTRKQTTRVFATRELAIEAAMQNIRREQPDAELTRVFEYQRPDGSLAFCVARFDWPGDKTFRPVHLHKSEWREGDPAGLLPLYGVNELPADGTIFVCEGEKARDAGRAIELHVTTSAHGSSSADKSDWTPLAGRDVVILPDNDEPGGKYARDVAAILAKLDPPSRVKVIALPGLPDGGDVCEFIDARDSSESEAIGAEIIAMADAVPFIDPAELIGGPVLVCLADVQAKSIDWLWPGRVPLGRITLLVGRPGEGKSFLTIDMAARLTTGTPWPDGSDCPRGSVILICAEDDAGDTIKPRLEGHYADCSKVHLLSMVRRIGEDGKKHDVMFTLEDAAALETALKAHTDCRLIVIDPIGSFLGGSTDAHRDNEVRSVLAPVAMLAEKYGAAVLVVAHRRKSAGSVADDLALGSRAFTGIARAVWHLSRDKDNKNRRLMLPGKNNLAQEGDGLAFTIAGDPPALMWEREPVRMSADDALANEEDARKPGPEPEARNAAAEWLKGILAGGPVPSGDLKNPAAGSIRHSAKAADLKWATIRRAADSLGVRRERCAHSGVWQWRLPKPGNVVAQEREQVAPNSENMSNLNNNAQVLEPSKEKKSIVLREGQDAHISFLEQVGGAA
jgi:putative DNA primase/helicase